MTINQASGQADPTNAGPIDFTVVFSKPVSDFATGDVTLSGAPGTLAGTVTGSGTTCNVAVSGMTAGGTLTASIGANVAQDAAGNGNAASTSTVNKVTFFTAPIITIQPHDLTVLAGKTATFTVDASGYDSVQWQVSTDGGASRSPISGATTTTLTLSNVTLKMNG